MPQGAIFADEHHVAANTGLIHGEEVADGDLFTGFERDNQILPAPGDGGHLVGGYRHLHYARAVEVDIAPGILCGHGGLLVSDYDVVHECSLLAFGTRTGGRVTAVYRVLGRYSSPSDRHQMALRLVL